ncbi:MAG: tRNA (adenosine(37)-N6)-threonylcarbamoyltransferase complex dimerization subunit type 1 TsaB [Pseudomonadota bacterium]
MILAFDTASAACRVALLSGDDVLASTEEPMAKGQAERLLGLCQELLAQAGTDWSALSAIGVGTGPGNFTGIRIAVSSARGLALGRAVPAVGVSAFDALAFGTTGPCVCAVAAPRDQVYLQGFGNAALAKPALYPADSLPSFDGPLIGAGGRPARVPLAEAIGRITAQRYQTETARPAPLYLRAPDAAPARDAPPDILP